MQIDDFSCEYRTKTVEDLSGVAVDLGPPLPAELSKPPWRPKVAGRIAFFFGPIAGASVVAISLRRMRYQQRAKKVMFLALGMTIVEAVILFFVPDIVSRLVGFGAEIAFRLIFPAFMEKEFSEWQAANPNVTPSSGWGAIGWGLLGILLFVVVALLVLTVLSVLLPGRQ